MENWKRRILIVDSDPAARAALVEQLSVREPYHLDTAENGAGALSITSVDEYSALITSAGLMDMTGFDLARSISERSPEVPVIVMAPKEMILAYADVLQPGVFDYLAVPYTHTDLLRMTDCAVRYAGLLRENIRLKCEVRMLRQNAVLTASQGEIVSLKETERKLLVRTLNECQGNKHLAAKLLRIPRSTLYSKIQKHHICIQAGEAEPVREFDRKGSLLPLAADR